MRPMQKSPPLPEFQRYQYAFTAHIRDPKAQPRPAGVEARRMKIYTELVYTNLENFLLACFPVLRKVLGTRKWSALVRDFFRTHRSHTPYFRQIPDEFIQFLQNEWTPPAGYPPFTLALAHYEWIELVLSVSTRCADRACDPAGDLLDGVPLLNPVLANLRYDWPVHRIAPRRKTQPVETHLLVFRDVDDRVQFSEINAFTARLLGLLEPGTLSGHAALEQVADESRHPDRALVVQAGGALLNDLRAQGAIFGRALD
ncbi:putative DNA-binding domain-containing protein [Thiobacillus sp.]|uniref:HvfC family RiPP maturation protein n=1 Tax=Thiobacillus sp. TaxID=924 RepID=UPI0025EB3E86|nr:putative DNA-binding domain-containing protein [Thiobacillus sp.]